MSEPTDAQRKITADNFVFLVSARESVLNRYSKLDDCGILNLLTMIKTGDMTHPDKIKVTLEIAEQRGLIAAGA